MTDERLEIDRLSRRYGDVVALRDGVLAADAGEVRWAGRPLTLALVWFAGRVYRNAVPRMGAKVRLSEALPSR